MIEIKTKSGFECKVDENVFDDAEFLDFLSSTESSYAIGKACTHILGADGKAAIYEHVRDENGKVRASVVEAELVEIMGEIRKVNPLVKK